jgi:HPt (histidine-containing phosphotransfer) domain-containing protein
MPDSVFDLQEALARVDHDLDIFRCMAEIFVDQGPKDLAAIHAALTAHDPAALARWAHRLKGAVLQFCAPSVFQATKDLEELGKAGRVEEAAQAHTLLQAEMTRLLDALRHHLLEGEGA